MAASALRKHSLSTDFSNLPLCAISITDDKDLQHSDVKTRRELASKLASDVLAFGPQRHIIVKPKPINPKDLDARIQAQITILQQISKLTNREQPAVNSSSIREQLLAATQDVQATCAAMGIDGSRLDQLPRDIALPHPDSVAICGSLLHTIQANIKYTIKYQAKLSRDEEKPLLYFRENFHKFAYATATSTATLQGAARIGANGAVEIFKSENGFSYAVKRPLEAATDLKCPRGLTPQEQLDFVTQRQQRVANGFKSITQESSILCHLPVHPGIMEFIGFTPKGNPILESIPGEELFDAIMDETLTDDEILQVAQDIAIALAYFHKEGGIHSDLKPENILLPRDPLTGKITVKIIDFGGSKFKFLKNGEISTTTPDCTSPELATRRGRDATTESDVWAYGSIIYSMLAKRWFYSDLFTKYNEDYPEDFHLDHIEKFFSKVQHIQRAIDIVIDELNLFKYPKLTHLNKVLKNSLVVDSTKRATMDQLVAMLSYPS